MTDNALKIIKDELDKIETDRRALVEMGSESKTKAKVFLCAKALSVAVSALEFIIDEKGYRSYIHGTDREKSESTLKSIANILSGGKDGK